MPKQISSSPSYRPINIMTAVIDASEWLDMAQVFLHTSPIASPWVLEGAEGAFCSPKGPGLGQGGGPQPQVSKAGWSQGLHQPGWAQLAAPPPAACRPLPRRGPGVKAKVGEGVWAPDSKGLQNWTPRSEQGAQMRRGEEGATPSETPALLNDAASCFPHKSTGLAAGAASKVRWS